MIGLLRLCLICFTTPVFASTDPAGICDRAAVVASTTTGVPLAVLEAIMLAETGRESGSGLRPWPWTVNMEGKGFWFASEAAARAYAREHYARGARSFDVGCFQINYKWHHEYFASLEAMFDPLQNAVYAANFLRKLFGETGDWSTAAGAYHSRSPEHAQPYRERFEALLATVSAERRPARDRAPAESAAIDGGTEPNHPSSIRRLNTFPLLKSGGGRGLGSLVPMTDAAANTSLLGSDRGG